MAIIRNKFTTELTSSKAKDLREFLNDYGFMYKTSEYQGMVRFEVWCSHYEKTEILDFIGGI